MTHELASKTIATRSTFSLLSAMSLSGAATILSGLLSAASVKAISVLAGPQHLALFSTLQQVRQTALIAATANGQTALVRGASSMTGTERREYVRAAAWIFGVLTASVILLLTTGERFGWHIAGAAVLPAGVLPWLTMPLVFSSAFVFASALLAAAGAVARLAVLQVFSALAMLAGTLSLHSMGPADKSSALGFCTILAFASAATVVGALAALWPHRRTVADWFSGSGKRWSLKAAGQFLGMAGAMWVSGLLASLVLLRIRSDIGSRQGLMVTGQWDAAWNISMNQAALILSSLQTHYLPELARLQNAAERTMKVGRVLTAASIAAAVVIAGIALIKPWVLTVLYSRAFSPGAEYLRWTLLGDYLKVGSWIFSIAIFATGSWGAFLAADLCAYATFGLSANWLASTAGAAAGASIAFVLMYAVHFVFCAVWLWKKEAIRLELGTWAVWAAGLVLVLAASGVAWEWR